MGGQRKEEEVLFAARRGACGLVRARSRRRSVYVCLSGVRGKGGSRGQNCTRVGVTRVGDKVQVQEDGHLAPRHIPLYVI